MRSTAELEEEIQDALLRGDYEHARALWFDADQNGELSHTASRRILGDMRQQIV